MNKVPGSSSDHRDIFGLSTMKVADRILAFGNSRFSVEGMCLGEGGGFLTIKISICTSTGYTFL